MSAKRRGLGRGLDALLGSEPETPSVELQDSLGSGMTSLPVTQLEPNRYQPRSDFDESGIDALAESIRAQGIVQPIVVTPKAGREDEISEENASPEGARFTIVAGERRWRAAQRAGLDAVPVVLRKIANDQEILELALVENLQRTDLNPIEEAEAYRTLGDTFSLSQEDIATRVGKGRTTVTNALRLLRLAEEIQDLLRDGRLTAGQARPLLAITEPSRQIELAERAVEKGLSARELETLAKAPEDKEPAKTKKKQEADVHTRAAMEKLTRSLQTRVDIVRRRRGGQVRIDFHSEEELIRLYDLLMQGNE
ncbi:MAG: ParB/RepB/Spo0J family partition protein [bacterium]|nr:ParB/RepB/Spo0J family partition protein [bacterium]